LLLIAVLVWLDRDGYRDVDDQVNFLDASYFATVSASTTGYGDISPVSDSARTVNTLLVTPLRVVFVVVLVGSTIEVATRASRDNRRVCAGRTTSTGTRSSSASGRPASGSTRLVAERHAPGGVVVVADDPETVADATAHGLSRPLMATHPSGDPARSRRRPRPLRHRGAAPMTRARSWRR
jgi:voltage-gated potassium channel